MKMMMIIFYSMSVMLKVTKINFILKIIACHFVVTLCSAQKQPYHGRFCGMLQESQAPGKFRYYNCHGIVWAMDGKRLKLTSFTFQQSFFLPENITFFIGPAVKTGNELLDIIPSANGYYLEAKVAPQKFPTLSASPSFIIAKRPTVKEVSLIKLRQNNANTTTTLPTTIFTTANTNSLSTGPSTTTSKIVRLPREAAIAERQPETNKKVSDIVPTAEGSPKPQTAVTIKSPIPVPEGSPKPLSVDSVQVQQRVQNTVDTVVPVAEPPHNGSTVVEAESVASYLQHRHENASNSIVVADLAESVQKIARPEDKLVVSDKGIVDKIIFENPSDKNQGQLILDSTRKVNISLLLATPNPTVPNSLITHGTVFGEQFSTAQSLLSTQQTSLLKNLESNSTTNETEITTEQEIVQELNKVWKPLSWYSGGDEIILDLPYKKRLSDFRWLSVFDHTNQQSIATLLLPNGKGFFVPAPLTLKGFKPTLRTKDVHSGSIQILDMKTIKITNFTFEGDAPGAWFMVGTSLFPTLSGQMVPILKDDGKYDCDYLQAYTNQTLILKLPGTMEATDVFWLSVFCVPYSISFAHVYLPYKDLAVPIPTSDEQIPHCMLEGTI